MIDTAKEYIKQYFTDERFGYHCLEHSTSVYEQVTRISQGEGVSDHEIYLLQVAALFHDTGYAEDPSRHEEIGADIAADFLKGQGASDEDIAQVRRLIIATQMDREPTGLLEQIIRDADLAHIGSEVFKENTLKLKHEKEHLLGSAMDEEKWLENNIAFLDQHKWYTKSAKSLYNKQKKANLSAQKKKLKALQKDNKVSKPEKGVETMYRVALRNHNQLSKIADNKANILLSITAIMLSLILSNLTTKIDSNPEFLVPTILIIVVNLFTMFYAILAIRPNINSVPYSRENFLKNKVNILFFGNFNKMSIDEFEWGMNHLQENRELLYNSLSKDLYYLGGVLAKKYKYLKIAYTIFMVGLIISALAFIWSFAIA